jgi:hypothetical protein
VRQADAHSQRWCVLCWVGGSGVCGCRLIPGGMRTTAGAVPCPYGCSENRVPKCRERAITSKSGHSSAGLECFPQLWSTWGQRPRLSGIHWRNWGDGEGGIRDSNPSLLKNQPSPHYSPTPRPSPSHALAIFSPLLSLSRNHWEMLAFWPWGNISSCLERTTRGTAKLAIGPRLSPLMAGSFTGWRIPQRQH